MDLLDYDLIVDRIQKHKEGYNLVDGKDIVFFIGYTGAGKTTTILYISGKEIKEENIIIKFATGETEDTKLSCVDPMPGFVIGHNANSETIAANTYDDPLSGLTLVDFAGQLDTNGPEIEIANTVGLYNTLSRVKSVRLVLVVDFNSIGTVKGQFFTNCLKYINGFIPNLSEKFNSLVVLFTHDPTLRKLKAELAKLRQTSTDELSVFLDHLIKYVNEHKEALLIDPTVGEMREQVVDVIKASIPLEASPNNFKFFLSNENHIMLIERLKQVVESIQSKLHSYAWGQIKHLLDDLYLLRTEISMMQEIVEIYERTKAMVIKTIQDLVAKIYNLMDLSDYKSVGIHLNHLAGASKIHEHISGEVVANSIKDILETINSRMSQAERDIDASESYILVREKFDLVKAISSHLHTYLSDYNKTLVAKIESALRERVEQQFADLRDQINSLSRHGNRFLEQNEAYLTDLMAYNFRLLSQVDKLFEGCTHYRSAIETLSKTLAEHSSKFMSELSKIPISPDLQLSFRVLRAVNQTQLLVSHVSQETHSLYREAEKALLQLIEKLNNSAGMHVINNDFAPMTSIITCIRSLVNVDVETFSMFAYEKLSQTINQMEQLIINIINEVQKKVDIEINSSTFDGCKFIKSKAELLQSALTVEREFSNPTTVSHFLAYLHNTFLSKALQYMTILEEALATNTFGDSPHGRELCALLCVGVIPEAVQQFQSWTAKYEALIYSLEQQVNKHLNSSIYSELAADFSFLNNINLFNSSFLVSEYENLNTIATKVAKMEKLIIEKIKSDWQVYQGEVVVSINQIEPHLSVAFVENQKTNLVELIEKLKDINATHLEHHLGTIKPSGELGAIAKSLRSRLSVVEADTRTMITVGHLDSAEKNLPTVDLLCTVLNCIDVVEGLPYSTLSSLLREKRLNLAQKIPEKLQRNSFGQVASILKDMQNSSGAVEKREFENICLIVEEYFDDLSKSVRCTSVDSVHSAIETLQVFDKAFVIDACVPELGIAATRTKISAKIRAYVDRNLRQFKQLLNESKLSEVYKLVTIFEELLVLYPDMSEFENISLQGEIQKHVKEMPTVVASILENGKWNGITKIDKIIEQLENVQDKLGVNADEAISTIQEQTLSAAKKKDSNIKTLITQSKIEEASEELHSLTLLVDLKCLAPYKAKGTVKKLSEDIDSSRKSQFSWEALHHNPLQLSEDLADMRNTSFSDYDSKMNTIEKLCNELANNILNKLETITDPSNGIYLRQLAGELACYQNIAKVFAAKHETFARKLQDTLDNAILPKLLGICNILQLKLQKEVKGRQWEQSDGDIKVMRRIAEGLAGFVTEEFVKFINDKSEEIKTMASATANSMAFLKGLNLFEPINVESIIFNLGRLKENASTHTVLDSIPNFESYEEVVIKILFDVEQKEKEVQSMWTDKNFGPIVVFLENLQQGDKLVKHDNVRIGFNKIFSTLTGRVKSCVAELEKKVETYFKGEKFDQLETTQKELSLIFKHFSSFREIFATGKNNVVEILLETTSRQANEFLVKFAHTVPSMDDVVSELLRLKTLSSSISNAEIAPHVHTEMNNLLNFLLGKKNFDLFKLGNELRSSGPLGRDIVEGDSFPQFKAVVIALMNKIIARMTPEDALAKLALRNKWTDTTHLQAIFHRYNTRFEQLLQKYLMSSDKDMDALVHKTQSEFVVHDWQMIKDSLPENLAAIFVVWSVSASKSFYQDSKNMETVLRPHPIQVLTIMCMLGLDTPDSSVSLLRFVRTVVDKIKSSTSADKLKGHLVQIGTGEGKSVILGILSTVLALLGCEVSCACYSSYLSERDYHAFLNIFSRFGVDKYIRYSTLAQLAGNYINEQGDIRDLTNQFVQGNAGFTYTIKAIVRPRVLLIDEVDTFLSKDFYGATYNPSTILQNDNVNFVLEYIWKNQSCTIANVRELEGYRALIAKYSDISNVIEGAIQRMICEVKNVNEPPYYCVKNKLGQTVIGYQENGTISTSVQYGYRTCFAYLQARDKGKVTKEIAQHHLGLTINCGQFSYAEIPKEYQCILGVTGTLETLCNFEKKVKDETYKVEKETYTPSIYGDSRLTFQQVEDVFVMSDTANYHLQLQDTIIKKQKAMQPVLVFFENELQLDTFAASSYGKTLSANVIKESTENIDFYIRKATRINESTNLPEVTFLPRVFGRGLDFACRDDRVNVDRGIHVIQAFLSEDVSEEIQIKGRTARQGKPGSYCLILHLEDLKKQFAITPEKVDEQKNSKQLYPFLHKTRVELFEKKSEDRKGIIERSEQVHHESIAFRELFKKKRSAVRTEIVQFLEHQNPVMKPKSKIVCLSDATGANCLSLLEVRANLSPGSMSSVWNNAKSQIVEMVSRIIAIGGAGKSELMWVAYRDYSDDKKIECSPWSSNPAVLRDFINNIVCTGGGDYPEAVELGLQQANAAKDITRVILIADAPPHLELKGSKLASHNNQVLATTYRDEATQLADKKVPVYCFYMNNEASLVASFKEIATITGGKAALFSNANTLIDVVAENVLDDIGGDDLVLEYRKTYHS